MSLYPGHVWEERGILRHRCRRCGLEAEERVGRPPSYGRLGGVLVPSAHQDPPIPCIRIQYTIGLVFSATGTAAAVRDGTKDVTRRLAREGRPCRWKVGRTARLYERQPFLGGRPFGEATIVSTRREPLGEIEWLGSEGEVRREGFPDLPPRQFVTLFAQLHRMTFEQAYRTPVWRIEFRLDRLFEEEQACPRK